MTKLEEKARQLAEEAVRDQAKPDKGILFVRYVFLFTIFPIKTIMTGICLHKAQGHVFRTILKFQPYGVERLYKLDRGGVYMF